MKSTSSKISSDAPRHSYWTLPVSRRRRLAFLVIPACLAAFITSIFAQSTPQSTWTDILSFESGFIYSRGDYGLNQDTEVFVVPNKIAYDRGAWVFSATVPLVSISGPAGIIGVGEGTPTSVPVRPGSSSATGIGDSVFSVTRRLAMDPAATRIELTGRLKLPTGDDARGIGTGGTDGYAQVDLYKTYETVTPFAVLGYRMMGGGRYDLRSGPYASGGAAIRVADGTSIGASLDWRDALIAGGDNALETSVFYFRRIDARWNWRIYGLKGFTDASPNYGGGAFLTFAF